MLHPGEILIDDELSHEEHIEFRCGRRRQMHEENNVVPQQWSLLSFLTSKQ